MHKTWGLFPDPTWAGCGGTHYARTPEEKQEDGSSRPSLAEEKM